MLVFLAFQIHHIPANQIDIIPLRTPFLTPVKEFKWIMLLLWYTTTYAPNHLAILGHTYTKNKWFMLSCSPHSPTHCNSSVLRIHLLCKLSFDGILFWITCQTNTDTFNEIELCHRFLTGCCSPKLLSSIKIL